MRLRLGVERRDVYGRLLAYVRIGRRFVNAMLVGRGLARTLTIPPNDRFAPLFRGSDRGGRASLGTRAMGELVRGTAHLCVGSGAVRASGGRQCARRGSTGAV